MKNFLLLWLGETISTIGSGMTAFAVGIYVYQQTGSALWVSLVALCAFLPTILLSPFAAVLSDRFDRRLLMMLGDLFSISGVAIVLIAILTKSTSLFPLLLGVTISAFMISPVEPAYKASVSDLLSEDEYARASGMVQIASSARFLISPLLAGILIGLIGIEGILIFDIGTFLVTAVTITLVRRSFKKRCPSNAETPVGPNRNVPRGALTTKTVGGFFLDFRDGFRAISRDNTVWTLIILMTWMCFFVGFIQVLMTPMVLSFTGEKELGIIESLSAIGMLAASLVIGIFTTGKRFLLFLRTGLVCAGLAMALIGVRENTVWIIVFGFLFFFSLPWINTAAEVIIRKQIPNALQARAWGFIGLLTQLGYVGAYLIAGPCSDYIFVPSMQDNGALASTFGLFLGTGSGRGIALMLIVSGIGMACIGLTLSSRIKYTERVSVKEAHHAAIDHEARLTKE